MSAVRSSLHAEFRRRALSPELRPGQPLGRGRQAHRRRPPGQRRWRIGAIRGHDLPAGRRDLPAPVRGRLRGGRAGCRPTGRDRQSTVSCRPSRSNRAWPAGGLVGQTRRKDHEQARHRDRRERGRRQRSHSVPRRPQQRQEPLPEPTATSRSGATRTRRTRDGTGPGSVTPGDSAPENGAEDDVLAKRVDARAIQLDKDPGGKDTATERYNLTAGRVQGWFCAEVF